MNKSLISDLLKTPSQIRQEEQAKLQQQALQRQQSILAQGAPRGSLFGGVFTGLAAQAAGQLDPAINRAMRGVGQATGIDMRSGAEKQAAKDQAVMKGVKTNDPASLRDAAKRVSNPRAREAMLAKADQIEASRASAASAAEQQNIENIFKAREVAVKEREVKVKELKEARDAKADPTRLAKLQAELNQINANIERQNALLPAELRTAEAGAVSAETQAQLDQALLGTNIAQAQQDLNLTTAQVEQIGQSVAQAAQRFPTELEGLRLDNLSTEASIALAKAQAGRVKALTPLEVKKIVEETQLVGYQAEATQALTEQRKEELKDVGSTDFLRELSAANLTPEEEKKLIKQRLEARAATGGVSGFGESVLNARLEQLTKYIETGKDARKSLTRAENVLDVMNKADIGTFSTAKSFANYWLGAMGVESAKAATAANELIQVLQGEITLDAAGNLKGALSDKDLQFLQDTIPSKDMSPEGIRNIFTLMAAERSAEIYAATQMDEYLATASANQIRETAVTNKAEEFKKKARRKYLLEKKSAGLYSGPMGGK